MTPLIEKYLNIEEIKQFATENNYDEISYNEFICNIDKTLQNDEKYGIDEEYKSYIVEDIGNYMTHFIAERNKGFSIEWAKEFAYRQLIEEAENAPAFAYLATKTENVEQALTDLKLFSNLIGQDEIFVKHFAFLIEKDAPNPTPSVVAQSVIYSRIYKEQINKGKTESFANNYADLIAMGEYTELGCYAEAAEYEIAILSGYPESVAKIISDALSEYIANYCSTYEESFSNFGANQEREMLKEKYQHLINHN